jgi:CRP-like cAMP-binding protein
MFGGERSTNVQAVSQVEVLQLLHSDLEEVLKDFPLIQQYVKIQPKNKQ